MDFCLSWLDNIKFQILMIKVRNKRVILELLKDDAGMEEIVIADDLDEDNLTKEIVKEAKNRKVSIKHLPRRKIEKGRGGTSQEVMLGFLRPKKIYTFDSLLDDLYKNHVEPFFLLLNRVHLDNNIGAIARTAYAAGANGLFFQGEENRFINEETLHYSLGAIARIPLVKMNIFEAMTKLKKNGIKTYSIQMNGESLHKENLSGPSAFVFGAEKEGLSDKISDRCDAKLKIPMRQGIDSLNVAVSAGIVLYEKIHQEKPGYLKDNIMKK